MRLVLADHLGLPDGDGEPDEEEDLDGEAGSSEKEGTETAEHDVEQAEAIGCTDALAQDEAEEDSEEVGGSMQEVRDAHREGC